MKLVEAAHSCAARERLARLFRTRTLRYVYLSADGDVPFGDVAHIIDEALREADFVSLFTPQLYPPLAAAFCVDANVPQSYISSRR